MAATDENDPARPITHGDLAKLTEAVESLARRFRRSMIVRALIVALAALAVFGTYKATTAAHDAGRGITQAQSAADRANEAIARIQADRRERRVENSKTITKLEGEIRELACTLVSQTPNDPQRPIIAAFRARYHCPPYSKTRAGQLPSASALPAARTVTVPVPVPGPTTTVTEHPAPRTTTVTATATVTRTAPPPSCPVAINGRCVLKPLHSGP